MDPISHGIIGAGVFALAGGELSIAEPAFIGCVVGSLCPDFDVVVKLLNDHYYLKHHRGSTHSLAGSALLSGAIAVLMYLMFPGSDLINIFLWTYIGSLSHIFFDCLNSYGVRLLWPISRRKFSLSILKLYDMVIVGLCISAYYLNRTGYAYQGIIIAGFLAYLAAQGFMRYIAKMKVMAHYRGRIGWKTIKILPSIIGFFNWDFVVMGEKHCTVGQIDVLRGNVKIRKVLRRISREERNRLLNNKVGRFFREFSPIFHISVNRLEDGIEVVYTDLRYWMRNQFMHHATAVLSSNGKLIEAVFHPYSRKNSIPF